MILHKSAKCQIKAAGPDDGMEEGQYRALVSVFNNKDSYGDVVLPGAFEETLAQWKASGDPIPVYWSHQLHSLMDNIGHVLEATETTRGLEVLVQLDLDNPNSRQAYKLLKGRRVTQHSFSYDIVEAGEAQRETPSGEQETVYELRKLKLYEVGPTPIGANQETELLAVKSATAHVAREVQAGRTLSAKDESAIREVHGTLSDLIAGLDHHDQEKASNGQEHVVEEPTSAKSPGDEEQAPAKATDPGPESAHTLAAMFDIYSAAYSGGEGA